MSSKLLDKFFLLKELGSGASANVRLAVDKATNKKYALKIMARESENLAEEHNVSLKEKFYKREVEVLQKLQSKNIIKMIDHGTTLVERDFGGDYMADYLCLEYAEHGSLFDFLYLEKKAFSESIAKNLFLQILNGLEVTHNYGIAHGDLKTENILVHADWSLKLCDFGNAFENSQVENDNIKSGTKSYSAPELLQSRNRICGLKTDIYSLGVILFILVTGSMPFGSSSILDRVYQKIRSKRYKDLLNYYNERIPEFKDLSQEFKDLFISLVKADPSERPSIEEIKRSKWLTSMVATSDDVAADLQSREQNFTH
jgi:serine/threonine protein kinase